MNKIAQFASKNIADTIRDHLRQKILLIILLILFCFVYVMVFAPPKTTNTPVYDITSAQSSQKITSEAPINLPFHMEAGEPIGITLYFELPKYTSADKYDLRITDATGKAILDTTFTAGSIDENGLYVAGLTNVSLAEAQTFTMSLSGEKLTEETSPSLLLMQSGQQTLPKLEIKYSLGISPYVLEISFWIAVIGCILILFYGKKQHINVIVSVLAFGILFALLTPILDVPDEGLHLGKAFMVANFSLFDSPSGNLVSNGLSQIVDSGQSGLTLVTTTLHGAPIQDGFYQTTLGNGQFFLGYLPSALVLFFGRIFHAGILPMFYAGRIINLVMFAVLAFFAVKIAPKHKIFFAVIAMMPMVLFISGSYNQDALTYGLALLVAAYFTKLIFEKDLVIGKKQLLIFILLLSLLSMVKYFLILFSLLILFIPSSRFVSKKTKWIGTVLCIIIPILAGVGAYESVQLAIAASGTGSESALTANGLNEMGANVMQQVAFLMQSVTTSISIFLRAFVENSHYYITQLFSFGWLTYSIPEVFIYMYYAFIALVAFIYSKYETKPALYSETQLGGARKFGVFLVLAATFTLINLVLYLMWTPVGAGFIQGVQGRYLIPLMLFLPFLTSNMHPEMDEARLQKSHNTILFIAQLYIILSLLQTLFQYY